MTREEAIEVIKYELCVSCPLRGKEVNMDNCREKDHCADAEAIAVLEKKGHWIEERCGALKRIVCSECGKVPPANVKRPYCPNCGSPME